MRIKVISRREQDYTREKPTDLIKVQRNVDPKLHPFEKPREYTRALNAVKLNKVFAKPFLGALSGHRDGIYSMAKHPTNLTSLVSGACDGEIRVWNVTNKQTIASWRAHKGFVRGLSISHLAGHEENEFILSCSEDKSIKMWHYPTQDYMSLYITDENQFQSPAPVVTYLGKYPFSGIDHQRKSSQFVTCSGPVLELWEHHHSEPVKTLKWNALTQSNNFDVETITTVKFNPIETHVLAAAATDRSILLYDVKSGTAIKRVILKMNTNALCWNPMETFNFTVANEDHQCYTFDARKLDAVLNVHKDHVSAVLDVDYSPTGKEFVTGSYDRTLRIFPVDEGRSREIYHSQRMQKIFCVKYSGDAHYVFSGSDDTNIRIWKSDASRQLGIQTPREMEKNEYSQKLIERYKHMPEIRRIHRKRHLPKVVYKIQKTKHIMNQSQKRKSDNVKANSRAGTVTSVPERKKSILKIVK